MSKFSLVRRRQVLGAIVMLAPMVGANAAAPARHTVAVVPRSAPRVHFIAHAQERSDGANTWMMLPIGIAAIGYAIRRRQRTLDSLQPLTN